MGTKRWTWRLNAQGSKIFIPPVHTTIAVIGSVQAIFSSRPSLNWHGHPKWASHLEPMTTCYMVEFILEKYLCYWLLHQFKLMKKTIFGLSDV
jgi:hypothetical protein